ncbi:MAG: hypothetical protein Q4E83_06910 [bacterium]|nr:hypothetical protein [bacterium]
MCSGLRAEVSMNNILAELEKLTMSELTYLFEYLVELINERKRNLRRVSEAKLEVAFSKVNDSDSEMNDLKMRSNISRERKAEYKKEKK